MEMRLKDRIAWSGHLDNVLTTGEQILMTSSDDMSRLRAVRGLMTLLKRFVDEPFCEAVGFAGKPEEFDPSKLPWAGMAEPEEAIWRRWQACNDLIIRRGMGPTYRAVERV